MTKKRALHIAGVVALWVVKGLLILMFIRAGVDKFSDQGGWARAFAHWGYPVWFRIAVGAAEVIGATLLVVPRAAGYGAALLAAVMLGGMYTHIAEGQPRAVFHEVVPLVLSLIVFVAQPPAWLRRRARPAETSG